MKEVRINARWHLKTDEYCYHLCEVAKVRDKESKNYGQEIYKHTTYHSTIKAVLKHIREQETKSNLDDFDKFVENIEAIDDAFDYFKLFSSRKSKM